MSISSFRDTSPDFTTSLALGKVPGYSEFIDFGYNATAPNVEATVWSQGSIYNFPPDAGTPLEIASTDVSDDAEIRVVGVDADTGIERSVIVRLDGTTLVPVPGNWLAVNKALNIDTAAFAGTVTIGNGGIIYAVLRPEDQETAQIPVVVPVDKLFILTELRADLNRSGNADTSVIVRLNATFPGQVTRTQLRYGIQKRGSSLLDVAFPAPIVFPPLTKIDLTATPDDNNTDISASLSYTVVDRSLVSEEFISTLSGVS